MNRMNGLATNMKEKFIQTEISYLLITSHLIPEYDIIDNINQFSCFTRVLQVGCFRSFQVFLNDSSQNPRFCREGFFPFIEKFRILNLIEDGRIIYISYQCLKMSRETIYC